MQYEIDFTELRRFIPIGKSAYRDRVFEETTSAPGLSRTPATALPRFARQAVYRRGTDG